jgi:hypothetical protein
MKKQILFISILLQVTSTILGQITVNLGLDSWVSISSYEEPANGWSTLNALSDLAPGAPVTVTKTTDKYSGTYAAKLETKKIPLVNTLIGGLLATGYFDNNASPGENLKLGMPYTSSPEYFRGYYKYTSVNSDSADFFCALTKWNSSLNKRDTLGLASYREYSTVSSYIQFSFKINYTDSISTPDTIVVLFSSSGGAQNFQGQVGSTLYVDEINFANTSGVYELLSNEIKINVYPNPTVNTISIDVLEDVKNLTYHLYNAEGKLVLTDKLSQNNLIDVASLNKGKYFLSVFDKKGLVASKKIIISK